MGRWAGAVAGMNAERKRFPVERQSPCLHARWQRARGDEGLGVGFSAAERRGNGETKVLRLHWMGRTVLERHIKVRAEANPYDPQYAEYFERRRCFAWRTLPRQNAGVSAVLGV